MQKRKLGGVLEVVGAEAGMHLVALLPPGVDDRQVAQKAAEAGLSVMPLSMCCLKTPARCGLILGYGGTNATEIHDGIQKLKPCLRGLNVNRSSANGELLPSI